MFGTGLNDYSKSNIVLTLGPHSAIANTKTAYKITGDLLISDEANRIVYYFNTNNELFVYDDMLSGASICQKLAYKQLASGYIYTSDGIIKSITQLSNNHGVIVFGDIFMKVLPLSTPRPRCIPKKTMKRVSRIVLSKQYKFFLGSPSSDLILISSNDMWSLPSNSNTHKFVNTSSKLETTITFNQMPSKPSNFPDAYTYSLKYPISVYSDNDYWITDWQQFLMLVPSSAGNIGVNLPYSSGTYIIRNTTIAYNGDGNFISTVDISALKTINEIPIPDNLNSGRYGVSRVAYVGNSTVVVYAGSSLFMYDMTTLETIGYIDINSDITAQLGTNDWDIDSITGTKKGLAIFISSYDAKSDRLVRSLNIYQLN